MPEPSSQIGYFFLIESIVIFMRAGILVCVPMQIDSLIPISPCWETPPSQAARRKPSNKRFACFRRALAPGRDADCRRRLLQRKQAHLFFGVATAAAAAGHV